MTIELPPGIALDDPRINQRNAPYTYFLPFAVELQAVRPGDQVKAVFRDVEGGRKYDAERMWVDVRERDEDAIVGILDNEPCDIDKIKLGDRVRIPLSHVISIRWADGHEPPEVPPRRHYWERCLVDACILQGRSHVDYLYREEPDMTQEGDDEPDSGWRMRGTEEAIDEDERQGEKVRYVALGAVLNRDDRWLALIDQPIGSRFFWEPAVGDYRPADETEAQ